MSGLVNMLVNGRYYRTIWMEGRTVKMIDQSRLPYTFEIADMRDCTEIANAINNMVIRGAPAIGAAGAYGLALAALHAPEKGFKHYLMKAGEVLKNTRPTGRDLFYAVDRILDNIESGNERERNSVIKTANEIAQENISACKRIGEFGSELIRDCCRVLTHCNAGWLACVDWGTALAPVYFAKRQGKRMFVYVDETRPRCQGSKLTAWELGHEGIDHTVIVDNAAGFYMQRGEIDIVIVGADRIALNGDVANKIGTYEKAVLAKENGIPFYVAAPTSTFDSNCRSGKDIPIEERDQSEVSYMSGLKDSGKTERIRVVPEKSKAKNPAFDITPARYITGIITEKGIVKPSDVKSLLGNTAAD